MNKSGHWIGMIGFALCSSLPAHTTRGQSPPSVDVSVRLPSVQVVLPSVEIHAESDFYEPLTPQGEWVVIGSHGRVWRPSRVEANWRPYSDGYWQRTDAGWYWASDEPWAWATYHYGRWDYSPKYGWYWVPQTQWAPAWVSWHHGGGYVGWAPLYPSSRFASSGSMEVDVSVIPSRAYVFVEERHFLEPVRRSTLVVNTTTIISKTVNITNTKVVNNTVVNEGPATAIIEKASGRKIQPVPVRDLRHKTEAAVVAKHPQAPGARQKPAAAAPETKPAARPEGKQPAANKPPTEPKAEKQVEKEEKPAKPSEGKTERPEKEKASPGEKRGGNPPEKGRENKPRK
jgi:hypothetical protein